MDDPIYFGVGRLPRPRPQKVSRRELRRMKRQLKKDFPKSWKSLWRFHMGPHGGVSS